MQKTLTNESRQCFNICQKNIIDAFREKNILFSNFLLENKISINNQYKYQDFDKILIGSDQVMSFSASWYKHEKMLLPEISADKKFFYAGATSNNVFPNLSDEKLKYLYDNYFKYVSTYSFRDIENYEDLKKSKIGYLFKNSSVNIDPVFLLDKKAWISIEKKPKLL